MTTTINEDEVKLQKDAIYELFQVVLGSGGGTLYLRDGPDVVWRGNTYEGIALKADGFKFTSDEEASRPKLKIANPEGIFSAYVFEGVLEGSIVRRFKVLKEHLDADLNIFNLDIWTLSRVSTMNKYFLEVELRRPFDGPTAQAPARMFIPPEFPMVSLG